MHFLTKFEDSLKSLPRILTIIISAKFQPEIFVGHQSTRHLTSTQSFYDTARFSFLPDFNIILYTMFRIVNTQRTKTYEKSKCITSEFLLKCKQDSISRRRMNGPYTFLVCRVGGWKRRTVETTTSTVNIATTC